MTETLPEPKSRKESYLAKAAGMSVEVPEKPESREEQYLAAIAEGGGGGSYTAGDGISITEGTISADLAQTTGNSTTKIMSQDAVTQALASIGGSFKELTSADYNYDSDNDGINDSLIIEKLPAGTYCLTSGVKYYDSDYLTTAIYNSTQWVINFGASKTEANKYVIGYIKNFSTNGCMYLSYTTYTGTGTPYGGSGYNTILTKQDLANNLYTAESGRYALDAYQGKALNDKINGRVITGAGAPTSSTVGTVGKLYEDTTNGKLYICTDATNPYVWTEVGAGGGGGATMTELTSADYNWNSSLESATEPYDCVALWLLPPGWYYVDNRTSYDVKVYSFNATRASDDYNLFGVFYEKGYDSYVRILAVGNGSSGNNTITQFVAYVSDGSGYKQYSLATVSDLQESGFTSLTPFANLNYPANSPDGIALFYLGTGHYKLQYATKIYLTATDVITDFRGDISLYQYENSSQQSVVGFTTNNLTTGEIHIGETEYFTGVKNYLNKVTTTSV